MKDISRRSFVIGGAASALGFGAISLLGTKVVANADTIVVPRETKWIWAQNPPATRNDYAEFITDFERSRGDKIELEIACDTIYAVYINNKLAYFAQCSDFSQKKQYHNDNYKLYDKLDITSCCNSKKVKMRFLVWHNPGSPGCQTFLDADPGLLFHIKKNGEIIKRSDTSIKSRALENYWFGETMRMITGQLGYSFRYDQDGKFREFTDSQTIETKTNVFHQRLIEPLELGERAPIKSKKFNDDTKSILIELEEETVGFVDVVLNNPADQVITIAYGEHTCDDKTGQVGNHVRRQVGGRDFSVDIQSKAGTVMYMNPLRRIAGKYLEVFAYDKNGGPGKPLQLDDIQYVGIRPVIYPVKLKSFRHSNDKIKKIYDACILTLRNSMHEHYEDCPWREQCLYGMDSRNQMLCGYYTFEGHEYQRHNLILLANSLRHDNMIEICSPCNNNYPIPMFSYCFVMALGEYLEHTGDTSILDEVQFAVDAIMQTGADRANASGMIPSFGAPFWNFYEWWPGGGSDGGSPDSRDLNLNTMYIIAHNKIVPYLKNGKRYLSETQMATLKDNIFKTLYIDSKHYFKLANNREQSSHLGNATAILAGLPGADINLARAIAEDMKQKRLNGQGEMVRASLSMKTFVYDALLSFNDDALNREVVNDILHYWYDIMIKSPYFSGTFWEDEEGQSAFGNAGSLCHGWSAMPAYYIRKYPELFSKVN